MRISNSLFFSVLTKEADGGGNVDTERKAAVKTIPTLGHQPVILGGLYSTVERRKGKSVVLQGEHCQYIDFANARSSGSGCEDGTKMVVQNK